MKNEFYTIREVAETLKISGKTVRAWIKAGKIRAVKLGRLVRISAAELQRFTEGE